MASEGGDFAPGLGVPDARGVVADAVTTRLPSGLKAAETT